jgi:hypothetical protein
MGNSACKYCNCPHGYYANNNHATRQSCLVSENGYHFFQNNLLNKIKNIIESLKRCLFFKRRVNADIQCWKHFT